MCALIFPLKKAIPVCAKNGSLFRVSNCPTVNTPTIASSIELRASQFSPALYT